MFHQIEIINRQKEARSPKTKQQPINNLRMETQKISRTY